MYTGVDGPASRQLGGYRTTPPPDGSLAPRTRHGCRMRHWHWSAGAAPLYRWDAARDAELVGTPPHLPCLLLSHGTGGSALQLGWLGTALAAQSYIVASVNHHGNTSVEPYTAQGSCLWWERAQDLSAVLDHLLADALFGARIGPTRTGAAGFSLGGYTVLAVAGGRTDLQMFAAFCSGPERDATCADQAEFPGMLAQVARLKRVDPRVQASLQRHNASFRDPRIRAVSAIAPVLGGALTPAGLAEVSMPVALVVGQADTVAPAPTNAQRLPGGFQEPP
jgi:predicted dienelactone hydrolase